MFLLNSVPGRFILAFYSIGFLILFCYTKKYIKLLLQYNSTYWYINLFLLHSDLLAQINLIEKLKLTE